MGELVAEAASMGVLVLLVSVSLFPYDQARCLLTVSSDSVAYAVHLLVCDLGRCVVMNAHVSAVQLESCCYCLEPPGYA